MMPSGTAMHDAKMVTASEPIIRGKMPNSGGSDVGYHKCPVRKSQRGIVRKQRQPSIKTGRA